jgi:hypothetical protein
VIDAWILIIYRAIAALWLVRALLKESLPPVLVWSAAVLAIATASYSGLLFAQARGRDLWQSPLFTWHLLAQTGAAGAAFFSCCEASFRSALNLHYPTRCDFTGGRTANRSGTVLYWYLLARMQSWRRSSSGSSAISEQAVGLSAADSRARASAIMTQNIPALHSLTASQERPGRRASRDPGCLA